jgi:hypothetical protein
MSETKNFFRKDDYVFGAFLGIVSPAVLLVIIHFSADFITQWKSVANITLEKFYLFALLLNIFFIRYYLVNVKLVKTGQSLIVVTFIIILLYFFFIGKI